MRRSRALTRGEQWELLTLLGILVAGLVVLAALWRLTPLSGLLAMAITPDQPAMSPASAPQKVAPAADLAPVQTPVTNTADLAADRNAQSAPQGDANAALVPPGRLIAPDGAVPAEIVDPPIRRERPRPAPEIKVYRGKRYEFVRTLRMRVTAYAPDPRCCYPYDGKTTASGLSVRTNGGRLVAADPGIVPLHWLVAVPGYHSQQPVPVLDRGGAIRGHRLDVLLPSYDQAKEWGSRILEIRVYRPLDG